MHLLTLKFVYKESMASVLWFLILEIVITQGQQLADQEFEISRDRLFDSQEQNQKSVEYGPFREELSNSRCSSSCQFRHQDLDQACTHDESCRRGLVCSISNHCTTQGLGTQKQGDKCAHQSDCSEGFSCLRGFCDHFGREGDRCQSSNSCRGAYFCHSKRKVCVPRVKRGQPCRSNSECLNSLCLRSQGQEASKQRYCAIIGVAEGKECNPKSLHCRQNLDCVPMKQSSLDQRREVFQSIKGQQLPRLRRLQRPRFRQNARRVRRFKRQSSLVKYICQSIIIRGDSNSPCASLIHCPCGEYCDRRIGKCRAATCTEIGGECPAYDLPFNFRCHHGVCMLPQEDIQASIGRANKAAKAANRTPKGKGKGKFPKAKSSR